MNEPRPQRNPRRRYRRFRSRPDRTGRDDRPDPRPRLPRADSLEVGLAAAFGKNSGPPRSSLGNIRPVLLKEAEGESSLVVKPTSDAMPLKEEAGDRYRFDGEIARGGMGAVLRGRDVDLGRDLAVKVLLEKYANRPDVARRFIEEAQIGGQLQHPGVVPIYDIGQFGDRPFFTMKLVKGQTLAAILGERTDPSADRPRLLGIALQVSQAMAYAHAKGVIHRDLKPANIMVGAFGEVQVMDWGLAKVLAEGGIARRRTRQPGASRARRNDDPHCAEHRLSRKLRHRHRGRLGPGHAGLHAARAGQRRHRQPRSPRRRLRAGRDPLRDPHRQAAVSGAVGRGSAPQGGQRGPGRRHGAAGRLRGGRGTRRVDKEVPVARTDRPAEGRSGVADGLSDYLDGVQERLQEAERERAVAVARAEEEAKTRQVAEEKAAEQRKRRRVQAQLAASVAALLLGAVSVAWWQTEQANARRETDLRRQLADEQRAAADNCPARSQRRGRSRAVGPGRGGPEGR